MSEDALNHSGTGFLMPRCLRRRHLLAMFLSFVMAGCATTAANKPCINAPVCRRVPHTPLAPLPEPPQEIPDLQGFAEEMLRGEVQDWLGTPHRLGGLSHQGIDCSGLVMLVYEKLFDLRLPRTSRAMMRVGQRVDRDSLAPGDLVFFKPRRRMAHVGIYLGQDEFVHTSTTSGVIISRMDEDFWQQCYVSSRRLF